MDEREREAAVERVITSTALNDVQVLKAALENVHPAEGDAVVITAGVPIGVPGKTNIIKADMI